MDIQKESEIVAEECADERNGVNGDSEVKEDAPSNSGLVGPPSPLTGCYLMIILAEPHSNHHKDILIQRLIKGFLSWDSSDCHVDLAHELNTIAKQNPETEEGRNGEKLIQYASENLVTEILIHPTFSTLIQCMRNMLSSFTRHKHIIHSGYTFSGNGSWILQDGTFSVSDFVEIFHKHDVQRVLYAYPNTITINIHCSDSGLWNNLPEKSYTKICKIKINPVDVLDSGDERINNFIDFLSPIIVPSSINDLLETSDVVGNIRFSHPTLYVFPGGQGDAALFGINGFNMLIDGGFNRKACFWDFVRHLDRLDAVLLTRLNNSTINGISAVLERKQDIQVYPQIGHFFCNIPETANSYSPDGGKDKDQLIVDLMERGYSLVQNLKNLNLKPHQCYNSSEPINLYHKVGHGKLDMYVVSPSKDSKEVKEFMSKWNNQDKNLFFTKETKQFNFPLQNLISICALLVWQPANPNETITRILFPGSTPDFKIQEGLQKLKGIDFMRYSTCSQSSLQALNISKSKKSSKASIIEKSGKGLPEKDIIDTNKPKSNNEIVVSNIKDNISTDDNIETTKKEEPNKVKTKTQKMTIKNKAPKTAEKKIMKEAVASEKKVSPATTPKKIMKYKSIPRTNKIIGDTPPKSTKDANNLKVLESKQKSLKSTKKDITKTTSEKKETKSERKPISRRPRGLSPVKKAPCSPIKTTKSKSDSKRSYIEKDGATADSSGISTPSIDDTSKKIDDTSKEIIDEEKQRELDDLKEEQEVVREIEAVFNRSEREAKRKIIKEDSTTEVEEEEEYLIIEKEEIEQYTEDSINEQESSVTKEEEFQKHQRDSQESEKQRKASVDEKAEEENIKEQEATEIRKETIENLNKELQEIISTARDIIINENEEAEESSQIIEVDEGKIEKIDIVESKEAVQQESVPEDKFSVTVESGATTTAPTLPEDERLTMDEIKENVVEEKYINEETKENEKDTKNDICKVPTTLTKCTLPIKMSFESKTVLLKDMVKTPDEVADLPVHEEVDLESYEKDDKSKDQNAELVTSGNEQLSTKEATNLLDNEKDNVGSNVDEENIVKDSNREATEERIEELVEEQVDKPVKDEVETKDEKEEEKQEKKLDVSEMEPKEDAEEEQEKKFDVAEIELKDEDIAEADIPKQEELDASASNIKDTIVSSPSDKKIPILELKQEEYDLEETKDKDTTASSPIDKALPEIELLEKDIAETKTRDVTVSSPIDEAMSNIQLFSTEKGKNEEETDKYIIHSIKDTVSSPVDLQEFDISQAVIESELRETHITSVCSPIDDAKDKVSMDILHDIAEDDEERKLSTPSIELNVQADELRPKSPREEEIAKIVADVAKVLKSDKDIHEIIPDFYEKEASRSTSPKRESIKSSLESIEIKKEDISEENERKLDTEKEKSVEEGNVMKQEDRKDSQHSILSVDKDGSFKVFSEESDAKDVESEKEKLTHKDSKDDITVICDKQLDVEPEAEIKEASKLSSPRDLPAVDDDPDKEISKASSPRESLIGETFVEEDQEKKVSKSSSPRGESEKSVELEIEKDLNKSSSPRSSLLDEVEKTLEKVESEMEVSKSTRPSIVKEISSSSLEDKKEVVEQLKDVSKESSRRGSLHEDSIKPVEEDGKETSKASTPRSEKSKIEPISPSSSILAESEKSVCEEPAKEKSKDSSPKEELIKKEEEHFKETSPKSEKSDEAAGKISKELSPKEEESLKDMSEVVSPKSEKSKSEEPAELITKDFIPKEEMTENEGIEKGINKDTSTASSLLGETDGVQGAELSKGSSPRDSLLGEIEKSVEEKLEKDLSKTSSPRDSLHCEIEKSVEFEAEKKSSIASSPGSSILGKESDKDSLKGDEKKTSKVPSTEGSLFEDSEKSVKPEEDKDREFETDIDKKSTPRVSLVDEVEKSTDLKIEKETSGVSSSKDTVSAELEKIVDVQIDKEASIMSSPRDSLPGESEISEKAETDITKDSPLKDVEKSEASKEDQQQTKSSSPRQSLGGESEKSTSIKEISKASSPRESLGGESEKSANLDKEIITSVSPALSVNGENDKLKESDKHKESKGSSPRESLHGESEKSFEIAIGKEICKESSPRDSLTGDMDKHSGINKELSIAEDTVELKVMSQSSSPRESLLGEPEIQKSVEVELFKEPSKDSSPRESLKEELDKSVAECEKEDSKSSSPIGSLHAESEKSIDAGKSKDASKSSSPKGSLLGDLEKNKETEPEKEVSQSSSPRGSLLAESEKSMDTDKAKDLSKSSSPKGSLLGDIGNIDDIEPEKEDSKRSSPRGSIVAESEKSVDDEKIKDVSKSSSPKGSLHGDVENLAQLESEKEDNKSASPRESLHAESEKSADNEKIKDTSKGSSPRGSLLGDLEKDEEQEPEKETSKMSSPVGSLIAESDKSMDAGKSKDVSKSSSPRGSVLGDLEKDKETEPEKEVSKSSSPRGSLLAESEKSMDTDKAKDLSKSSSPKGSLLGDIGNVDDIEPEKEDSKRSSPRGSLVAESEKSMDDEKVKDDNSSSPKESLHGDVDNLAQLEPDKEASKSSSPRGSLHAESEKSIDSGKIKDTIKGSSPGGSLLGDLEKDEETEKEQEDSKITMENEKVNDISKSSSPKGSLLGDVENLTEMELEKESSKTSSPRGSLIAESEISIDVSKAKESSKSSSPMGSLLGDLEKDEKTEPEKETNKTSSPRDSILTDSEKVKDASKSSSLKGSLLGDVDNFDGIELENEAGKSSSPIGSLLGESEKSIDVEKVKDGSKSSSRRESLLGDMENNFGTEPIKETSPSPVGSILAGSEHSTGSEKVKEASKSSSPRESLHDIQSEKFTSQESLTKETKVISLTGDLDSSKEFVEEVIAIEDSPKAETEACLKYSEGSSPRGSFSGLDEIEESKKRPSHESASLSQTDKKDSIDSIKKDSLPDDLDQHILEEQISKDLKEDESVKSESTSEKVTVSDISILQAVDDKKEISLALKDNCLTSAYVESDIKIDTIKQEIKITDKAPDKSIPTEKVKEGIASDSETENLKEVSKKVSPSGSANICQKEELEKISSLTVSPRESISDKTQEKDNEDKMSTKDMPIGQEDRKKDSMSSSPSVSVKDYSKGDICTSHESLIEECIIDVQEDNDKANIIQESSVKTSSLKGELSTSEVIHEQVIDKQNLAVDKSKSVTSPQEYLNEDEKAIEDQSDKVNSDVLKESKECDKSSNEINIQISSIKSSKDSSPSVSEKDQIKDEISSHESIAIQNVSPSEKNETNASNVSLSESKTVQIEPKEESVTIPEKKDVEMKKEDIQLEPDNSKLKEFDVLKVSDKDCSISIEKHSQESLEIKLEGSSGDKQSDRVEEKESSTVSSPRKSEGDDLLELKSSQDDLVKDINIPKDTQNKELENVKDVDSKIDSELTETTERKESLILKQEDIEKTKTDKSMSKEERSSEIKLSEVITTIKSVEIFKDSIADVKESRSMSVSTIIGKSSSEKEDETVHQTPPTAPVSPDKKIEESLHDDRDSKDLNEDEEEDDDCNLRLKYLKEDPMSTSVYGELADSLNIQGDSKEGSKELTDVYKFLDEAELNFKKALDEHVQLRGAEVMTTVTSKYEVTEFEPVKEIPGEKVVLDEAPKTSTKPDENDKKSKTEKDDDNDDKEVKEKWGKPSSLPSPAPEEFRTTPKKEKRAVLLKTKINNEKNLKKMSDISNKEKGGTPIYVDLTYVPHQGNGYYSHLEFFKNIRARYYVFSSTDPHREVFQALLDAKQLWEDKSLEVTIIPTYDTDTLGYWVSQNEELLAQNKIDLSPSASRCTINLQDHETSCSAYRLEF